MDDSKIIALYFDRSEQAISETAKKYGRYCHYIAFQILHNTEDSEECVNDTYFRAWSVIPPKHPEHLRTFLGKITRNLSLNKWEKQIAQKRGNGQCEQVLEELIECIPSENNVEKIVEDRFILEILNDFLYKLPADKRKIFVCRYWYFSSIKEIAKAYGISESKVTVTLFRTRQMLKEVLEKEGVLL
ncbi:MAG: sigma-70 family RNA polymerase sigma factor [Agathobacter sp.]|nr:sigma-70 family RNA polymerase sigma factor [Agathobacter sp.]